MPSASAPPLITVLLPVRDGERWIRACLESLAEQTFQDFEILLIDDGCTDSTIELALQRQDLTIHVLQGPQQGLAAALALGVTQARGEFLARQDVDDLSAPDRLRQQVRFLQQNPNCVAVGSAAAEIDEEGRVLGTIDMPTDPRELQFRAILFNPMIHTSVMMRRLQVLSVGNYWAPSGRAYPEDFDLWSRLLAIGQLANLQDNLVSYRRSSQGVSALNRRALAEGAAAIAARNVTRVLGDEALSEPDKALIGAFHGRTRRMTPREAFRLWGILWRLGRACGWPSPLGSSTLRTYVSPAVWVVRKPRT